MWGCWSNGKHEALHAGMHIAVRIGSFQRYRRCPACSSLEQSAAQLNFVFAMHA